MSSETTEIKEFNNKKYTLTEFKDSRDWRCASITTHDVTPYAEGEHRPYGESGLISVVNYETIEKAKESWEKIKKEKP